MQIVKRQLLYSLVTLDVFHFERDADEKNIYARRVNESAIQTVSSETDRNWGESESWERSGGTRELIHVENGINPLSRLQKARWRVEKARSLNTDWTVVRSC